MLDVLTVNYKSGNGPAEFVRSLKNTGFAVLNSHPIEMDLVENIYDEWQAFFNTNKKYDYQFHPVKQDGYFPYKSENAKGYKTKDLKEFYHIYPWGRYPEELSQQTRVLYTQLVNMATELLKWIETGTPKEISSKFSMHLSEMVIESPQNLMRIIHYPALSGDEEQDAVRAAAHEDINLITLLCAGSQPGLQVQDIQGSWIDVDCDPGTIVVNSGDMLQMCSEGYYPSTTHRVINPDGVIENKPRFSLPLFLHPKDDVQLSEKHTAGSYLFERLQEIGLK